ncbi:MAG: SDR family NAD(P)-dependent oxidoreductase [Candidatus Latescibacterota bacterium]|nr:SDR family NAD(P)-dependent oxidoreductase [Candidatus Latescibacterota bacterium]
MSKARTALITGAGSGIGQGIAIAFAREGINLALLGRTKKTLEDTARACGTDPLIFEGSIDDRNRLSEAVRETEAQFGSIEVLVNNAGMNTKQRNLIDMPPDEWDRVIEINLTGTYNCFKAVLPGFLKAQNGLVINISSMAGKSAGTVGGVAYSASKFGMGSLTQSINAEFRERGIRATCIYPGEVDTPILDNRPVAVSDDKRAAALQPEDVAAAALMVTNLHHRAIVEEITIFPRRVVSK